jgi:hypothetical protein
MAKRVSPRSSTELSAILTALAPRATQFELRGRTIPASLTENVGLTDPQLAALIGVSPKTVKRWRAQKKGPRATKFSDGTTRTTVENAKRWIEGLTDVEAA